MDPTTSNERPPPELHLISPFESSVQHGDHLTGHHLHIPLLHRHSHPADCPASPTQDEVLASHPALQRARQKAKSAFLTSPLLDEEEYIFPRFRVGELLLGKVLGRGGFGTVLEILRLDLSDRKEDVVEGGIRDLPPVRKTKSFDALGDIETVESKDDIGELRMFSSDEETKTSKRRRRSVSLGFGNRDGFSHRKVIKGRGSLLHLTLDGHHHKEQDQQMQQKCEQARQATSATSHSLNFSFVSWRDSLAGQEGRDAIDEHELRFLNGSHLHQNGCIPEQIQENEAALVPDDAPTMTDEMDEGGNDPKRENLINSAQVNENSSPRSSNAPSPPNSPTTEIETIATNHHSPTRRRIILYSKTNDGVNTTFEEDDDENTHSSKHDKHFMSRHATTSKGKARYVVKIISPHIVRGDFKKFLQAASDMATETYFFSVLNHRHILKMRAVGQGDMFSPSYFLVLDRLYGTLNDRIGGEWKHRRDRLELDFFVWGRGRKMKMLWEERLGVAKDLAGALSYLHDMCIIYRDLKPENVGFDGKGVTKLFDFGLAKQVRREDATDGTYRLTANTGSIRYMSPEVGDGWPYNFKADSYSFAVLLWEMLALEVAFDSYTPQQIVNMARKWGERPKLKDEWSERLKEAMRNGWDSNFRKRPTMKDFELMLELEVQESQAC
ncbi:hypothetical protein ACHAW6_008227 [Cyclotella cf. meneghiniana]